MRRIADTLNGVIPVTIVVIGTLGVLACPDVEAIVNGVVVGREFVGAGAGGVEKPLHHYSDLIAGNGCVADGAVGENTVVGCVGVVDGVQVRDVGHNSLILVVWTDEAGGIETRILRAVVQVVGVYVVIETNQGRQ